MKGQHYSTPSQYTHIFHSWSEFVDQVEHGERTEPRSYLSLYSEYDDWAGASLQQALRYCHDGWPVGIAKIRELQRTLPPDLFDCVMPVTEYKPELRHQIAGGVIDVAAHLSGATPETFIAEQVPIDGGDTKRGNKVQSIYCNIRNNSDMDENAFFYRGAYTYLMIEHMEQCGYSTEVYTVSPCEGSGMRCVTYIKVKEFGELFDTNKLAIALCSSYMCRRLGLVIEEMYPTEERKQLGFENYGCYGIPIMLSHSTVTLPFDSNLNPIWISSLNQDDPTRMLAEFRRLLREWATTDVIQA